MKQNNTSVPLQFIEGVKEERNDSLKKLLTQKLQKDLYIFNDQDHYIITISVAGYLINDFNLKLKGNHLIVKASRFQDSKSNGLKAINWNLKRNFRKEIILPNYDFEKNIDLSYNGRVLKITFSKKTKHLID